jgi:hypothetical protein
MQPISRTLRVAAFSLLTTLDLPTWPKHKQPRLVADVMELHNYNYAGVTLANDTLRSKIIEGIGTRRFHAWLPWHSNARLV